MADPKKPATATPSIPGIRVIAKTAGFRRAGVAWSTTPSDVPLKTFNPAQLAQLRAEPRLVVSDIDMPVAAE